MGVAPWAVPVGVLGAIVACGFIFIWWWFPRAWQHGVNSDAAEVAAVPQGVDREAQRQRNRAIIERFARARARERGEVVDDSEDDVEMGVVGQESKTPAVGVQR